MIITQHPIQSRPRVNISPETRFWQKEGATDLL